MPGQRVSLLTAERVVGKTGASGACCSCIDLVEYFLVGGSPVEGYRRTGCFTAEPAIVLKPYVCRWKTAMCAYD